ncbi:carbohydrate ABC transporter permease [Eisenbergiella sp.]
MKAEKKQTHRHMAKGDILFYTVNTIILLIISIIMLYPYLNTVALSFNDGTDTLKGGITIFPRKFTLQNYISVFRMNTIIHAAFVSVLRTSIGTIGSVFCTAMVAYTLSRKEYVFRKPITMLYVFTMYFNAGLIPNYFLSRSLGLLNNFWVYIIPGLVSAFNVVIIRTYISGLSESFIESARLDGAGHFTIFLRIIMPLCKPVLATVALFCAVGGWNAWFDNYIYCPSNQELSTLQYELMKLLNAASSISNAAANGAGMNAKSASGMVTPAAIRAAITVVVSAPILLVYPFLQKYFVTGLTIGGVKE